MSKEQPIIGRFYSIGDRDTREMPHHDELYYIIIEWGGNTLEAIYDDEAQYKAKIEEIRGMMRSGCFQIISADGDDSWKGNTQIRIGNNICEPEPEEMSLYEYMTFADHMDEYDCYDDVFDAVVAMCPVEEDDLDPWSQVNNWILQNVRFIQRTDSITVVGGFSEFVEKHIEQFKEFTKDRNKEHYMVRGDDDDSLYAGVLTIDSLIVGNYSDDDYKEFIRIFMEVA